MKKSPYANFTLDEVAKIERSFFVIHFGGDFLLHDKSFMFTEKEAIKLYNSTMKDLMGIVRDGTEKDRAYALDLLWTTSIEHLILH